MLDRLLTWSVHFTHTQLERLNARLSVLGHSQATVDRRRALSASVSQAPCSFFPQADGLGRVQPSKIP